MVATCIVTRLKSSFVAALEGEWGCLGNKSHHPMDDLPCFGHVHVVYVEEKGLPQSPPRGPFLACIVLILIAPNNVIAPH